MTDETTPPEVQGQATATGDGAAAQPPAGQPDEKPDGKPAAAPADDAIPPTEATAPTGAGGEKPPPDEEPPATGSTDEPDVEDLSHPREESLARKKEAQRLYAGPTALGDGSYVADTIYIHTAPGSRREVASTGLLSPSWLAAEAGTYVEVDGFEQMRRRLLGEHVLYLPGPVGTGRFTTACRLLVRCSAVNRIVAIDLDQDLRLSDLYGDGLFRPGHGHVLELRHGQAIRLTAITTLREKLTQKDEDRGSYLVIIGDEDSWPDPVPRFAITYCPPDPAAVFRKRLSTLLRRQPRCVGECRPCVGACVEPYVAKLLDRPEVRDEVEAATGPENIVELATVLAASKDVEEGLDKALGRLRSRLRKTAQKALAPADGAEPLTGEVHAAPRRHAFRLGYALFDGYPLKDVFTATTVLLRVLHIVEAPAASEVSTVFDEGVHTLLGELEAAREESSEAAVEVPRRARLANPAMTAAILDVAWHDFSTTREPLLAWFDALVSMGPDRIRLRVAVAVGYLARFDFDQVYALLIGDWARSSSVTKRRVAAWALEAASYDRLLIHRVRSRIRDWARSTDANMREAAAHAYATSLGSRFPEEALRDLDILAAHPAHAGSRVISQAVAEVCDAASAPAVLEMLENWALDSTADRPRRLHAARSLLLLSFWQADEPDEGWPALLLLGRDDPAARRRLVLLWRVALAEKGTGHRAWDVLLSWLIRADGQGEVADETVDLVAEILRSPSPLAARAPFYLAIWTGRVPESSTVHAVRTLMEKDC